MTDITANVIVSMPSQLFTMARSFKAVANGKIYIGKIDTDPVNTENQIQVYVENEDGSHVPVSQPIIINAAGYPVYNGQIAKFVTVQGHSMAVYDAYGSQQFYFPNVLKYDPDQFEQRIDALIASGEFPSHIGYKYDYEGAKESNLQSKLDQFITLADFADSTGESDSTESINKAFEAARNNGKSLYGDGTYLVSGSIETYGTQFDFSQATFIVDGATLGNDVKLINITDPDTQTVTSFNLGSYNAEQGGTPNLSAYDECSVAIDSTESAYLRAATPSYTLMKKDILVINKNVHRLTPALFTITTPVTLTVKPLRPQIHCKLPKFVINSVPTGRLGALVYISRNNVKLSGGFVDSESLSAVNNRNILESFIRIEKCAFPVVTDVNTKLSPLDYSYQVVADQVHGLVMERCNDQSGWRLQDGNYLRNSMIRDCQGRGIGGHAMVYNYSVENFLNCYNGIQVTGKGFLSIKNSRHVDYGGNLANGGVVKIREDYGTSWDGNIEIDGLDIVIGPTSTAATAISIIEMWAAYTGTQDYTQTSIRWGRTISIKNVHVENLSSNQLELTSINFKTSLAQNITPPAQVKISDFTFKGSVRPLVSGFPLYADSKVAAVTTTMFISNIQNDTGLSDLTQNVSDADKPNIPNKVIRKYHNFRNLNITLSVPSGHKTYVYDSVVTQVNGAGTDLGHHYFYNCRMTGNEFSTNQGFNHFYNCHFDTSAANFKVGTRVTIGCHINAGATITSGGGGVTSASLLWNYKSSIYA
ncbi:phage head-binding domain-containing protein [Escherichia coli]